MSKSLKSIFGQLILNYLRFWAKLQLSKNPQAVIIGITGSAGKTSTRLALVKILKKRGVVKHSVHANSESGIPLNILGIKMSDYSILSWLRVVLLAPLQYVTFNERYNFYVVEMGIDSPFPPKNMDYLLSIIRPHIAIILGASLTHAAGFDSLVKDRDPKRREHKILNLIAKEKMKLAQSLAPDGVAILNCDNAAIMTFASDLKCRTISFGLASNSTVKISQTKVNTTGFHIKLNYQSQNEVLDLPDIYGSEYGYTFAAAIAAALSLGISLTKSISELSEYRAPAGRMRVFSGMHNSHLLDSSYNASPSSVKSALKLISQVGGKEFKIAVLGDLRELGSVTKTSHQILAQDVLNNVDEVVLFGEYTAKYTLPLLQNFNFPVHHFTKMSDLIAYLRHSIKPNSWILFKGSQNEIYLERAVEALLANPSDSKFLARRGKYWDQKRSLTP